jgi:hypothetical protein
MTEDLPGIEQIRQIAKLNLSDDCYKAYLSMIEPGIRSIIQNYMRSWQDIESVVTRMVMVHKKIYKTDLQFVSLPHNAKEKYSEQVDVNEFNKVKFGMSFKEKIRYLQKIGLLQHQSYKLLYMLNKRRNKIHEIGEVFTQRDLNIFAGAYSVVFYILMTITKTGGGSQEMNKKIINDTEDWAQNLIFEIEKAKHPVSE